MFEIIGYHTPFNNAKSLITKQDMKGADINKNVKQFKRGNQQPDVK